MLGMLVPPSTVVESDAVEVENRVMSMKEYSSSQLSFCVGQIMFVLSILDSISIRYSWCPSLSCSSRDPAIYKPPSTLRYAVNISIYSFLNVYMLEYRMNMSEPKNSEKKC